MAYTTPVVPASGDTWGLDEFNLYVVDNITALHALLVSNAAALEVDASHIVIGSSDNSLTGLEVGTGYLVVGSASGVTTLAPGSEGQVVTIVSGVPAYADLEISIADLYTATLRR